MSASSSSSTSSNLIPPSSRYRSLAPTSTLPATGIDIFVCTEDASEGSGGRLLASALLNTAFDDISSAKNPPPSSSSSSPSTTVTPPNEVKTHADINALTAAAASDKDQKKRKRITDNNEVISTSSSLSSIPAPPPLAPSLEVGASSSTSSFQIMKALQARHVRIGSRFDNSATTARVDFLVLVVSMLSKRSYNSALETLNSVHKDYILMRKCCVLLVDWSTSPQLHAFPMSDVEEELLRVKCSSAEKIMCIKTDVHDSSCLEHAANGVLRGAKMASRGRGIKGGVSPLFFSM